MGIICSSTTKAWLASVSAKSSWVLACTSVPACRARKDGSTPTKLRLRTGCEQPPAPAVVLNAAAVSRASWEPLSWWPPLRASAAISLSAQESRTKISFSPTQRRLLSKAPPEMMSRAALSRSPVPSTKTGGLPGPAQIARLPHFMAAATTAGPPVTQSRRTSGALQSASKDSSDGCSIVQTRFSIPMAALIATL